MEITARATVAAEMEGQYSLAKILGSWAQASVPGALLYWLGLPIADLHFPLGDYRFDAIKKADRPCREILPYEGRKE